MRKTPLILAAVALVLGLTACESDGGGGNAVKDDAALSEQALSDLQLAHPTPRFERSQLRQNLVEIITSQAQATQTTTFFYNLGIAEPVHSCPSIGFPIATTAQLTNPQQSVSYSGSGGRASHSIPQVEPTGIYTGDSTGTYVICIDAEGRGYANYWEGFVQTVAGPAEFVDGAVTLIGPPSFEFTAGDDDD